MINLLLGENNKYKEEYINSFILSKQKSFPDKFFVVVPEQSNLERQVSLLNNESNKSKGLLNIEVSSYNHLAYNFFSYVGYDIKSESMLDEIGKIILLRKLCEENKNNLSYYGNLSSKPGFIDKLKSAISELYLYGVDPDNLISILNGTVPSSLDRTIKPNEIEKYKDIAYLYKAYIEKLKELNFTTPDDTIDKFYKMLSGDKGYEHFYDIAARYYKNVEVLFDDFTGITPVQKKIIYALSKLAREVYLCIDLPQKAESYVNKVIQVSKEIKEGGKKLSEAHEECLKDTKLTSLFYMSKKYIFDICLTSELEGISIATPRYIEEIGRNEETGKEDLSYFCNNILRRKRQPNNVKESSNIKVFESLSLKEEISYVASQISHLVKNENYRYKDICIITKNSEIYKNYIVNEFQKKDIPFFMDIRVNLTESPYVECLRFALEAVVKNFSTDSILRFLSSRLFEADFELDNYIRKVGISGVTRKNEVKGFSYLKNTYVDALIALDKSIPSTGSKSKSKDDAGRMATGELIANSIRGLISDLKLNEKFDKQQKEIEQADPYLYRAYASAKSAVEGLLDMISSLLKDTELSFDEFVEIFDTALMSKDTKILPVRSDQVLIGNLMHSRFVDKKVLFFIGLNTECIPIIESNNSLISENFKEILGTSGIYLSQKIIETAYNSFYYTYMHFKTISDKIYLTYSKTNDDKEAFAPNKIMLDAMRMFSLNYDSKDSISKIYSIKDLKEFIVLNRNNELLSDKVSKAKELYTKALNMQSVLSSGDNFIENIEKEYSNYHDDVISPSAIKSIVCNEIKVSVSGIEQYSACPYSYFLDRLLGLKEREEFEITDLEYGNICHFVLSELFKYIKEKANINSSSYANSSIISQEEINEKIKEEIEKSKDKFSYHGYNNKVNAIFENMEKVLLHSFSDLASNIGGNNFYTESTEEKFISEMSEKDKELGDVKYILEGRIDRTDIADTKNGKVIKIVDYKTGKLLDKLNKEDVEEGHCLQLLTYMGEARKKIEQQDAGAKVDSVIGVYNGIGWDVEEYPSDIEDEGEEKEARKDNASDAISIKGLCSDDEVSLVGPNISKKERIGYDIKSLSETGTSGVTKQDIDYGIDLAYKAINDKVKKIISGNIVCNFRDASLDETSCNYCHYKSICRHKDFIDGENGDESNE